VTHAPGGTRRSWEYLNGASYPLPLDQHRVAVLNISTVRQVKEYRRNAAECDALARNASSEAQREQILKIAETWRKLAADRERQLRSRQHIKNR